MSEFISFVLGGIVVYLLMKWQPWDRVPDEKDEFPTKKFPRPPRMMGRGR